MALESAAIFAHVTELAIGRALDCLNNWTRYHKAEKRVYRIWGGYPHTRYALTLYGRVSGR